MKSKVGKKANTTLQNQILVRNIIIIALLIIIVGWLIINNVNIPYKTEEITSFSYTCEDNKLEKREGFFADISEGFEELGFNFNCVEHENSKHKIFCRNNEVHISCKTTIYKRFIKPI